MIDIAKGLTWSRRRTRTATVIQHDMMECGAAALKMVMGYWGCWVDLEELRDACGVSRAGSKASNIVRAARAYGFDAQGLRVTLGDLNNIRLPCILHWEFNHFVVLEALFPGGAKINDPQKGRRKVSIEEVDRNFTGIALTFLPNNRFEKRGAPPSLFASLWLRLRSSRDSVAILCVTSVMLIIASLLVPAFGKLYVDYYLIGGRQDWLRPTLFAFAMVIAFQAATIYLQRRNGFLLEMKLATMSTRQFVWRLLNLPTHFYAQRLPGDLSNRVACNQRLAELLSGDLVSVTIGLASAAAFAVVMLLYDAPLGATAIVLGIGSLFGSYIVWERQSNLAKQVAQNQSRMAAMSVSGLGNIESMKAKDGESAYFDAWAGRQAEFVSLQQRLGFGVLTLTTLQSTLSALTTSIVMGLGAYRVMKGAMTIGDIVAFQALVMGYQAPIRDFVLFGSKLRRASADVGRIDDVIQGARCPVPTVAESSGNLGDIGNAKLVGGLRFANVNFAHGRLDQPYIKDFNLVIKPGSRVGLVGKTGSGKSTVAALAVGLYEPHSGEIRYDGKLLRDIKRSVFGNSIAFVGQDAWAFSGSIYENLTLWDETVNQSAIHAAVADACLQDVVLMRGDGYLRQLQEQGRNLSGGERQRLAIARALAHEPSILVLDEATSALDPIMEREISDNLRRRGCTCIIVAHRLSAVRDCDEIVVLRGGSVVETGTHQELIAQDGEYALLMRMQ